MQVKLVTNKDLAKVKDFYQAATAKMRAEGICLWDDMYPLAFLACDVENEELYCLQDDNEILAAFALCKKGQGTEAIKWSPERDDERILYLYRFAVSAQYKRIGLGGKALEYIFDTARKQGATTIRFFVDMQNVPALSFYKKQGLSQQPGLYVEEIDENLTLREYGYEKDLMH